MLEKKQKNKIIQLAILMMVVSLLIFLVLLERHIMISNKIMRGVFVEDIYLGGRSARDAKALIEPLFDKALERKVMIKGKDNRWSYLPSQLKVKPNVEKTVNKILLVGRQGYFWERWWSRWQVKKYSLHVPLVFEVNEDAIANTISFIAEKINTKPQNAEIIITKSNKIEIVPETYGKELDQEESKSRLRHMLLSSSADSMELVETLLRPDLTAQEIERWEINDIIATFETKFNSGNKSRSFNIKKAAQALDKTVIMPNQVFSFNKIVGPRTKEAGYKEALVIENNRFIPGVGGGVCQVSTALYNAALRANLAIIERHPHSLPVSYVPAGLDATVSYNTIDLKFINSYPNPILLHTKYQPGKLTILIFGKKESVPKVKITRRVIKYYSPETEIIQDPIVPPGVTLIEEKGRRGMEVEVKREIIINGKVFSQEILTLDKYKAQNSIVKICPRG
ncbi:MAG: VanW family protein [Bacillota bacterium]